jgi:hypothetical protein
MSSVVRTLLLVSLPAVADPAAADGDVGVDRKVAEQHFSRCHVIDDDNEYGGIGSTPSFQLLASSFPDYKNRFATFFARRPHPVFAIIESYGRRMPERPPNAAPVKLPWRAVADVLAFFENAAQETLTGLLHELSKMSLMNSAFTRQAQAA